MHIERRFTNLAATRPKIETRGEGDAAHKTIVGYAAVFYREGDPATEFRLFEDLVERVMPAAFDAALARGDDVRGTYNHEHLLGRTTKGTARVSVDSVGLRYEIDLPDTSAGRDVEVLLRRGDLDGSSFGFLVRNDQGREEFRQEGNQYIRELHSVRLVDVGPVIFPAYEGATSGIRSTGDAELRSLRKRMFERRGRSLGGLLDNLINDAVDDNTTRADVIERMASAAGISAATVNNILGADINCPPLERLQGFARALDVPVARLRSAAEDDGCDYGEGRCQLNSELDLDIALAEAELDFLQ